MKNFDIVVLIAKIKISYFCTRFYVKKIRTTLTASAVTY